ncbi:MAG: YqaE/Pmp3 family membrane protein [Bacteroidales bacterium]|jgi:uncharacterized membrane protein YqaE (UPF0057 family)
MKNLKILRTATLFSIAIMLFLSCGTIKNNDFSRQKYTNFSKGEAAVHINKVTKEKKDADLLCVVPENKEVAETAVIADAEPSQSIATLVPEVKNETDKTINSINLIPGEIKKVKLNRVVSLVMKRHINKTNAASVAHSDISAVLLVILAIIIPPLAVYLVRGIGTPFWIDLVLTLLFWLPGIIYALFVVFD